jgi:hypothetical protein
MKTIRTYINVAEAGFASSLLEAAGIPTLLKDEASFMMTPGPATGGIQLQVNEGDAEKALRVLDEGLDAATGEEAGLEPEWSTEAKEVEPPERGGFPIGLIFTALAFLGLLAFAVHQWRANQQLTAQNNQTLDADYDHDGHPDHWSFYRAGVLERSEADRNRDRLTDEWGTYDREGRMERWTLDQNFDGKADSWSSFNNGEIKASETDGDFDGQPDWFTTYEHGVVVRNDVKPGNAGAVQRRYVFQHGMVREELVDEDRDGKFDYKIPYDAFGAPSERQPIEAAK